MEEAIRVCIRQRPLFQREIDAGHVKAWKLFENGTLTLEITPPAGIAIKKAYAFDMCFDENATNESVYDQTAQDIVRDTAKGINGCYMAYGQTGCGKTHSIMGTASDPGMLPRAVAELFDIIDEAGSLQEEDPDIQEVSYLLRVSYVEIYLERVNDLFQDGPKGESQPLENLDVKEDPKEGFYVVGLAERVVSSIEDVMKLLQQAEMKRHFACTNFNETSSRSHTVFSTLLEASFTYRDGSVVTKKGEMKLVDLAGNERASASEGLEGAKDRQAEGQAINRSLFLLSEVIAKLSKKAEILKKGGTAAVERARKEVMHIPWRDSKLTRLLQKSLGGNSRAALLVAVHPSTQALEISLSTLRFALKTKSIKKKVQQNFVSPEQSLIAQQKEQIKLLMAQLKTIQEMTGVELPESIAAMAPTPVRLVEKAMPNEAIEQLKTELKNKVDRLSKIILTHRMIPEDDARRIDTKAGGEIGGLARSITIGGVQGRLERQRTLAPLAHQRLYHEVPPERRDVEPSKVKSIVTCLNYLKNINDINAGAEPVLVSSEDAGRAEALARFDTVRLDDLVAEDAAKTLSLKTTRRRMAALRNDNSRLSTQARVFQAQNEYLQKLLNGLGLSVLITGVDGTPGDGEGAKPELSSRIGIKSVEPIGEEVRFAEFLKKIQPMAFSMISKMLAGALDRGTSDDVTRKIETKTDLLMSLLSPWEQYILALLFEQQESRSSLETLQDKFQREVGTLRRKLNSLLSHRAAMVEHCARLVDELRHFRYNVVAKSEPAANDSFTRLLAKLEKLSSELTAKTARVSELETEADDLAQQRDDLQEQLLDIRGKLFSFDPDLIPEELHELKDFPAKKQLIKEVLLLKHMASKMRLEWEELDARNFDLRKVNQQISLELRGTQSALETLEKEHKLLTVEFKNERAALTKRFQESYDAYREGESIVKSLRAQLARLTEENKNLQQNLEEETHRADAVEQDHYVAMQVAQSPPPIVESLKSPVASPMRQRSPARTTPKLMSVRRPAGGAGRIGLRPAAVARPSAARPSAARPSAARPSTARPSAARPLATRVAAKPAAGRLVGRPALSPVKTGTSVPSLQKSPLKLATPKATAVKRTTVKPALRNLLRKR